MDKKKIFSLSSKSTNEILELRRSNPNIEYFRINSNYKKIKINDSKIKKSEDESNKNLIFHNSENNKSKNKNDSLQKLIFKSDNTSI